MKTRRILLPLAVLIGLAISIGLWFRREAPGAGPVSPRDEAPPLARAGAATAARPRTGPAAIQPPGASPAARSEGARPAAGTLLVAKWGSGPGKLGRTRPSEANPEAPASFTLDAAGRLLVLDKANGRIVRYDASGKELDSILVTQRSPQELVTTPDGTMLVMDRLADRSVAILDQNGKLRGELPIVGEGIEQGGNATGLFYDQGGVYVESEHSQVVRIGSLAGIPDPQRPTLDGRPSRDGKSLLSAHLVDRAQGKLWVRAVDRATGSMRFQKQVVLGTRVLAIVFLDSDASGGIYVGAHVGDEVEPGRVEGEAVQVVCLGPGAEVRGMAVMPANTGPEESFRDLAVRDDGTLVYMERTESGVAIRTYRCG